MCGSTQLRREHTIMPHYLGAIRSTMASFRCDQAHTFFVQVDVVTSVPQSA
jgi:hypothetical protein